MLRFQDLAVFFHNYSKNRTKHSLWFVLRGDRKGGSPLPTKPSVIPGSDCAAKIILTGSSTSKFKPEDRVSPNSTLDHVYGAPSKVVKAIGLSGKVDGVWGEYRVFPENVSRFFIRVFI